MAPVVICKILHLFFLISWLGSLLVLPRLFSKDQSLRSRLQKIYCSYEVPSMILALLFGIILFCLLPKHMKAGWFHMKLTSVLALVVIDILVGRVYFSEGFQKFKLLMLQVLTVVFLLLSLTAVYGLRNKEAEWLKAQQEQQRLLEQTD